MGDEHPVTRYEEPAAGVARVVLARPEKRNAQNKQMLYELNDAFDRAGHDDAVKVVILAADGPDFSAGHDLRDTRPIADFEPVTTWGGYRLPGVEGHMALEEELFLGLCWRWRDFPKPTIAQVQGRVILAGLMLVWPCDLIVASRDARFSDPAAAIGAPGGEFFVHAFELGPRVAKRMLFTGDEVTAEQAYRLGMVTDLVDRDDLERHTLELAEHIATRPSIGLKLVKQAVNQSVDAQGLRTAVQAAFSLHQLAHAQDRELGGDIVSGRMLDKVKADRSAGRTLA